MNTQSNTMAEVLDARSIAPAAMAPTRPFYWSVRRELWENRSIYVVPLAAAGLFLCGHLISLITLPHRMRALSGLDPEHQRNAIAMHYDIAAALTMGIVLFVGLFYCLEAFQGERRDRSILFWKSLPVSDVTTVLAKASIPLVVIPVVSFGITVVLQWIMLLLTSVVLGASGQNVAAYWTQLSLGRMQLLLLYHLVAAHVLWAAPIYCWLLLVSAWVRRTSFLWVVSWAVLPPVAIVALEKVVFNTTHFATLLGERFSGDASAIDITPPGAFPTHPMTHITPLHFLFSPGLWIGLAIAAAFLAGAVWLRRERGPM
jgi:ABC-2 type transport system permease protein